MWLEFMNVPSADAALRRRWIDHCLTFAGAYEDYPFTDSNWTVMRHRESGKTFALIYERQGYVHINVKCEPMQADFYRQAYASVTPGYHMNKTHWNAITLDGSIPDEEIASMIGESFHLTSRPASKRRPPET